MLKYLSSNSIDSIVTSQNLSRLLGNSHVTVENLLFAFITNKNTSISNLIKGMKIETDNNICSEYIIKNLNKTSFYEVPFSKEVISSFQSAKAEWLAQQEFDWHAYMQSKYILKAILLNYPDKIRYSFKNLYSNKEKILKTIDISKKFIQLSTLSAL